MINKKKIILQQMKASRYEKKHKAFDKEQSKIETKPPEYYIQRRIRRRVDFMQTFIDHELDWGDISIAEWERQSQEMRIQIWNEEHSR